MAKKEIINLIKASRIKRTLPILAVILLPAAYTNKFPISLFYLASSIILIYSSASIYNAYKDKDYKLPPYFKKLMIFMVILALSIASLDKTIFIASIFAVFLGYIYNTKARFFSLGDSLVAGITHYALPVLVSSLLVDLNLLKAIPLSMIVYTMALCIGPITDLKDIKKDRKLGYKTIVSDSKNPKKISLIFLNISFLIMIFLYLFLQKNQASLLLLIPVFLIKTKVSKKIKNNKPKQALNLMRLYLISSFILLILVLTYDIRIAILSVLILFFYLFALIKNYKGN